MHRFQNRRLPWFIPLNIKIVFLLLLAVACGGSYNPESGLVDVGGHRLNVRCSGEGSPAAVLVSGLAIDNHDWVAVEKQVSDFAKVCSYDRAGLGQSDDASGALNSQTAADDLRQWILSSGIQGQVILVGHSYGGLVVQLYAAHYPEDTFGVVLVDSLQEDNLERAASVLGDQTMAALMLAAQANPEGVDLALSFAQVKDMDLGDIPLTVLTAGDTALPEFIDQDFSERLTSSWLYSQRELARMSTTGVHFVAEGSGHCIQCDRPDLVVDAIREMADEVRFK